MAPGDTGAARLCVTNATGGTGKTTVAVNVAGALNERGREVLFVDLDPQGNATEGLGLLDAYDARPPSLFDVLTDARQRDRLDEIVVSNPEMDVVPSNIDMEDVFLDVAATLDRRFGYADADKPEVTT